MICDRLRALCEEKNLPQGDIEKRTGAALLYLARGGRPHGSHRGKSPTIRELMAVSAFTRTYAIVPLQTTLDQRGGGPLNCG